MFGFTGHLREEEEWAVGDEWGARPSAGSHRWTPSGHSTTRRVDMAAVINQSHAQHDEREEMGIETSDLDKYTAHTQDESNDSSDIESQESEYEWACYCSPCAARLSLVVCAVVALFVAGLGVGLAVHFRPESAPKTVSGANGQETAAPAATGMPTLAPSGAPPPNSDAPTVFFDFNYDDMLPSSEDDDGAADDDEVHEYESDYLVGAYYYPWHGDNFHNRDGYMRKDLTPGHGPTLGEYNDSDPATISQHLKWSRQANIGLWISSWWGPNRLEDTNVKDVILPHEELGDMKIALHYETSGRIRNNDFSNVRADLEYMCENYFDHPNYYKVRGRPVVFVYVTRKLEAEGVLEPAILTMRSSASKCGHDVFVVGDHVFADAPDEPSNFLPFWYFDAVTNYDVYGSMGRPSPYAGRDVVDAYYDEQLQWRTSAIGNGCHFIPAISPGYNDRGVRLDSDHPPLSRKLEQDEQEGSLFYYALRKAKPLVDPMMDNLLVVNSFNEWHEDTQIEPAVGETTTLPTYLTHDVSYVGYGELYLNILREGTIRHEE